MSIIFIRREILFGLLGAFIGAISRLTIVDLDLFHEMSLFREIIHTGEFLYNDIFSYVPTISPVVHHEWGSGSIFYFVTVYLGLGSNGLMILKYILSMLVVIGCYFFATRQGGSVYSLSFIGILGISLGWIGFTTIRAQLLSLLLLVLFFYLIELNRKGKKWALFAWLPVYTIWLNVHGGFIAGFGLFLVYMLELFLSGFIKEGKIIKTFNGIRLHIAVFILMCMLTLVNPYGHHYLPYIWNAIFIDRTPYIAEWRPVWEASIGSVILMSLSLCFVLYAMTKKKFHALPGLFFIFATAWVALWHYRHLPLYAIAWCCYAPSYIEDTKFGELIKRTWENNYRILGIVFVAIGVLGTGYAVKNQFWELRVPTSNTERNEGAPIYPAGAVRYLKETQFSGNLMVPFSVGGYVSWNLYPDVKVSMDSRFEVAYPMDIFLNNMDFYEAREGWQNTINCYKTDAILVPRWSKVEKVLKKNVPHLNNKLTHSWVQKYVDDAYSVYCRSDIARHYQAVDMRGKSIIGTFP